MATSVCYLEGESTYEHKDGIKAVVNRQGGKVFSWNKEEKVWEAKNVPNEAIDRLSEIVERKFPGVVLRMRTADVSIDDAEIPF